MKQVFLDTDDIEVAEEVVSAFFGRIRMDAQQSGAPTRARMARLLVGSTSFDETEFDYTFGFTMTPPDKILLTRIHSGAIELTTEHGPPEVFGPDQVGAVGALDGKAFSGTCYPGRWDTVLIDNAFLGQVVGDRAGGDVRLRGSTPVSAAANRHLVATIDYVRDAVAADPDAALNPMIAGAAQRHLAASVLAAYPNTAVMDPTAYDRSDSTSTLIGRAIAFIDDNADRDISLADIAEAVSVSPRAVQYMFRRHRNCTPMQYVRTVRLHHAHNELAKGDPTTVSVTDIARRWGFAHMGRFAANYRLLYGQSPHATLRN